MSGAAKKLAAPRRDYDRRRKRGPIRNKTVRPLWRQPMMLGLVVLLLGCGGGGGWWAWHEGWLVEARKLTDTMVDLHGDKERGAFYYVSRDHEKLFARAKDQFDGAQPSGNSVAAQNLVRLWEKTGDAKYEAQARRSFKAMVGALKIDPSALTGMAKLTPLPRMPATTTPTTLPFLSRTGPPELPGLRTASS